MSNVKTVLVGTVGQGIMRSGDGGESWGRAGITSGLHSDALVRDLANHPDRPGIVVCWHRQRPLPERRRRA